MCDRCFTMTVVSEKKTLDKAANIIPVNALVNLFFSRDTLFIGDEIIIFTDALVPSNFIFVALVHATMLVQFKSLGTGEQVKWATFTCACTLFKRNFASPKYSSRKHIDLLK